MFSQASVKNSVHRKGRGELSTSRSGVTPPRHTLGLGIHPSPGIHPPRRPLQRTVRILLECIPVAGIFQKIRWNSHINGKNPEKLLKFVRKGTFESVGPPCFTGALFLCRVSLHWGKANMKAKFFFDVCTIVLSSVLLLRSLSLGVNRP